MSHEKSKNSYLELKSDTNAGRCEDAKLKINEKEKHGHQVSTGMI